MSGAAKLSAAQVDQLAEWAEAGRSDAWIGSRLGVSGSGVCYHRTRLGIARGRSFPAPVEAVTRSGQVRTVRLFTQNEDKRILSMRLAGATQAAIAAHGRVVMGGEQSRIARWWAAGSAWFFGYALAGAIGVPFWRDQPSGDGFDLSLTAAVAAWFLVGALRRPARITRIDVSTRGIVVHEADA